MFQVAINISIYSCIDTGIGPEMRNTVYYYTGFLITSILLYYSLSFSNPGYLRVKDEHKDGFNQNMMAIETQFRNGNISFLEHKPAAEVEEFKTQPGIDQRTGRTKHKRKQSVLTKDISKHRRSKSPYLKSSNVVEAFTKKTYAEFTDEVDPVGQSKSQYFENLEKYKK